MDTVMMGLDKNLIGQKLEKDVYSETGILVVAAGTYISEKVYQKMESYFINNVHIKKKETKDKKYQDYAVIKSNYAMTGRPVVTSTSSPPSLRMAHSAPVSVLRQKMGATSTTMPFGVRRATVSGAWPVSSSRAAPAAPSAAQVPVV